MKISAISIPAMTRRRAELHNSEFPALHGITLALFPWLEYSCGKNAFDYLIAATRRAYKIINVRQLQT